MAAPKGNKNAIGNSGQPPMFSSPEEMQTKVDQYFESIKPQFDDEKNLTSEGEPATITGLALFLGFESRQSLYDYGNKIEFSYTCRRARTRVENSYEKHLYSKACSGAQFALSNMGWKNEIHTTNTNLNSKLSRDERKKRIKELERRRGK